MFVLELGTHIRGREVDEACGRGFVKADAGCVELEAGKVIMMSGGERWKVGQIRPPRMSKWSLPSLLGLSDLGAELVTQPQVSENDTSRAGLSVPCHLLKRSCIPLYTAFMIPVYSLNVLDTEKQHHEYLAVSLLFLLSAFLLDETSSELVQGGFAQWMNTEIQRASCLVALRSSNY